MSVTIVEIIHPRKCPLAFDSIALRYAARWAASQHVLDVGGKRRVGVDVILDLAGGDAKAHCKPEDVDELLAGMPNEMRAEDAVGCLIDDDFRPRDGLRVGPRRKPAEHVIAMNLNRKALVVCGGLGQADRGERWHGVDRCR